MDIESKGLAKKIKGKGTYVLNRTSDHHLVRTLGSIWATRRGFLESLIAALCPPLEILAKMKALDEESAYILNAIMELI